MEKLRIGITADTYMEETRAAALRRAPYAPRGIVEVIADLGALPFILPDAEGAEEAAAAYASMLDALILPGGLDTDPTFFGEEPRWDLGETNAARDVFELAVLRAFIAAGKPVLGICRGMQLINIAQGGAVYQDLLRECPEAFIQHQQKAAGDVPTHHVRIEAGSLLARAVGERAYVNSRHHQAVSRVAAGLRVTARADDGVIEALESEDGLLFGVQWHPEDLWRKQPEMKKIFADLLERAEAVKK